MENSFLENNLNVGRFFSNVIEYANDESKECFQNWLNSSNLSSHMQVIAKKV